MFGKSDNVINNSYGYENEELLSELELSNLIKIATNPVLSAYLNDKDIENIKVILAVVAKDKIARTMNRITDSAAKYEEIKPIKYLEEVRKERANKNR